MGEIFLIRHGQASFGTGEYDNLSELGILQARTLGAALKPRLARVDSVVCGAMLRHKQTAESCLEVMGRAAELSIDPGWNEYNHENIIQVYEPRYRDRSQLIAHLSNAENPWREFGRMFTKAISRWMSEEHDVDYQETWPHFCARVEAALERLDKSDSTSTTMVFTSGGPISVVIRKLLRLSDEQTMRLNWNLVNTGITKLISHKQSVYLSTLNEYSHLPKELDGMLT